LQFVMDSLISLSC